MICSTCHTDDGQGVGPLEDLPQPLATGLSQEWRCLDCLFGKPSFSSMVNASPSLPGSVVLGREGSHERP